MDIKVGAIVIREGVGGKVPHKVEFVRDNGKVVLRDQQYPSSKATTVKLANIGVGRESGKTYYVEDPT